MSSELINRLEQSLRETHYTLSRYLDGSELKRQGRDSDDVLMLCNVTCWVSNMLNSIQREKDLDDTDRVERAKNTCAGGAE